MKKIFYSLVLLLFLVGLTLPFVQPFVQPVYADSISENITGEGGQTDGGYLPGGDYTNLNSDDGDTSYLITNNYGVWYHCYNMVDFAEPAQSIDSVTLTRVWYGGGNASTSTTPYYRIGGANYYGTILYSNTYVYQTSTYTFSTTGWSTADLNNAEWGIKSIIPDGSSTVHISYLKITVNYTPLSAPTVTTSTANPFACTSATLNGNITVTGGVDPAVTVYWGDNDGVTTPGSWDNSVTGDNITSPGTPTQGIAAFYHDVTGLVPGTLMYFSASATNSEGTSWGTTKSFTTWKDPVIATADATDKTVSSARLQSYLVDDGGTTCQVRFGWGSIDKGTDIDAYNGVGSPSAFAGAYTIGQSPYLDVDNLVSDNTTYFNVQAQNVCGSDNGTSKSFVTGSSVGSPSNVTAIPGYDNVVLSWVKGVGAPNTYIRFRANACPADETDGALIYVATGSTFTHVGLTSGIDYCYLLVGYDPVLLYSDNYTIIHATTLAAGSAIGTTGTAISNPSSMTQTPSVSAALENNIPLFVFIRGGSTSTGIPMGSLTYIFLLIILAGLSYAIYKWTHSIEAIVIICVFASWVAYPTLHIPVLVPIFVSLVGIGYGIYRIRSIV
ncbi:hypothetical protein MUP46_01060 [Patescibacteria group bacterium]|nr:hypothetical protein [Patescibacteria group bacterium]